MASRRALLAPTPTQTAGQGLRAAIYARQYGTLPIPDSWEVKTLRLGLRASPLFLP